jgi:amidase
MLPKPKARAMKTWRAARLTRWQLDLSKLRGKPSDTSLQQLAIPLPPFLGCVGVAPEGTKGIGTGASGPYGGNMDFRLNTTGAVI